MRRLCHLDLSSVSLHHVRNFTLETVHFKPFYYCMISLELRIPVSYQIPSLSPVYSATANVQVDLRVKLHKSQFGSKPIQSAKTVAAH